MMCCTNRNFGFGEGNRQECMDGVIVLLWTACDGRTVCTCDLGQYLSPYWTCDGIVERDTGNRMYGTTLMYNHVLLCTVLLCTGALLDLVCTR